MGYQVLWTLTIYAHMEEAVKALCDALRCPLCEKINEDVYCTSDCGHILCSSCFISMVSSQSFVTNSRIRCPACGCLVSVKMVRRSRQLSSLSTLSKFLQNHAFSGSLPGKNSKLCSSFKSLDLKTKYSSDSFSKTKERDLNSFTSHQVKLLSRKMLCESNARVPTDIFCAAASAVKIASQSESRPKKTIVLLTSALSDEKINFIKQNYKLISGNEAAILKSSFCPKVTHLITTRSEGAVTFGEIPRTTKCILAILFGCHIVSFEWFLASKASNSYIDCAPSHKIYDLPSPIKVFLGRRFYILEEAWTSKAPLISDIKAIIRAGSGSLVREKKMQHDFCIYDPNAVENPGTNEKPFTWLFDCVLEGGMT